MRPLTEEEAEKIKFFTANSIELSLIEPTKNGLGKYHMDAIAPVRLFLKENLIHDFDNQRQGEENKVIVKSFFLSENHSVETVTSLYRPQTKDGDPRIWFGSLPKYADANNILGILAHDGKLYVINLSKISLSILQASSNTSPINELIAQIREQVNVIVEELLLKLRKIASLGPIPSGMKADTAIGRTLEMQLGIRINSSKTPDYKGIELKSYRSNRDNRKTLFAQVPNWELSKLKSSGEILNAFGYSRKEDFKLYCTVSTAVRNSQGLMLRMDKQTGWLIENSDKNGIGDFAIWTMENLHKRLLEKHNETFWIAAKSTIRNGVEYFEYTKVEHTRKPITTQFDILLEQGIITLDHLIKRKPTGGAQEKGPLFKIDPKSLSLLFPPTKSYDLR